MNKRKIGLALLAVFMTILLVGSTGCGAQEAPDELSQLRKDVAQLQKQLLEEKQGQEAKKQKEAEEERIAQIVAKTVEGKLGAFETKLAEKEKEDRLAELEKKLAELEKSYPPSWPSPCPPCYPSSKPYCVPAADFLAQVYQGDFGEYVGYFYSSYPINYDWGLGGPLGGLTNYFSVRWEGNAWFEGGTYRFRGRADDGFRLWVDGQLLIDRWSPQTVRTHEVTHYLTAGYHNIRLEYRELTGYAKISLFWERIN